MTKPHGGVLIDGVLSPGKAGEIVKARRDFVELILSEDQRQDVRNIAYGVYSPLPGFLYPDDFREVVSRMRLTDGTIWPIPIVLDVSRAEAKKIGRAKRILLADRYREPVAILQDVAVYPNDKDFLTQNVFGTRDKNHPGVAAAYQMKDFLVGGRVELLRNSEDLFRAYNFTPQETRKAFQERGWRTVAAFQTRNMPHRGHEFLQKQALKETDGLFIQPVVGSKKPGDFQDHHVLHGYELLINSYFPRHRVILGALTLKMRYAGPREAVFHALLRKNFGCTHFIVGRDHAGAGGYYSPLAAQEIFDTFKKQEVGLTILKYPEAVYDKAARKFCFAGQCPDRDRLRFSGTEIREKIQAGHKLPAHVMRPRVYNFLTKVKSSLFVGSDQKSGNRGFVVWLTGLPQAGKSSVGDRVYEILKKKGCRVERLDGDVVRQSLTRDLGFSRKDREENVRRVGHVARLLSQDGVAVIVALVSPYRRSREELRRQIKNFIEVFVNAPLGVCEQRDGKGMYGKARRGEIKNFTGISDPYERPDRAELELRTDREKLAESANKVVAYLQSRGLI